MFRVIHNTPARKGHCRGRKRQKTITIAIAKSQVFFGGGRVHFLGIGITTVALTLSN